MRRKNDSETSIWISTTDLMSGMLVVFLFIAVLSTQGIQKVADASEEAEKQLEQNIAMEFTEEEQREYHMNADNEGVGYASFPDGGTQFEAGSAALTPEFAEKLRSYLPRYVRAIRKSDPTPENTDNIQEIRIEGHTSSEWFGETGHDAYIKNMALSQARTRTIIEFAISLPELSDEDKEYITRKMTANGLSSSKLIYKDEAKTIEDEVASRRIEFRTVANDEQTLKKMIKELGR